MWLFHWREKVKANFWNILWRIQCLPESAKLLPLSLKASCLILNSVSWMSEDLSSERAAWSSSCEANSFSSSSPSSLKTLTSSEDPKSSSIKQAEAVARPSSSISALNPQKEAQIDSDHFVIMAKKRSYFNSTLDGVVGLFWLAETGCCWVQVAMSQRSNSASAGCFDWLSSEAGLRLFFSMFLLRRQLKQTGIQWIFPLIFQLECTEHLANFTPRNTSVFYWVFLVLWYNFSSLLLTQLLGGVASAPPRQLSSRNKRRSLLPSFHGSFPLSLYVLWE